MCRFTLLLLFVASGITPASAQTDDRPSYWVADTFTREKINRIKEGDIDFIEIFGDDMVRRDSTESVIVDDKELIHKFVTALRLAVYLRKVSYSEEQQLNDMLAEGPGNPTTADGIFRVHLKGQKTPLHDIPAAAENDDLIFVFRSGAPKWCFGEKFQRCLRELGNYQARKIRQRVADIAPDVVAFRLGDHDEMLYLAPRLNEPATVKQFLSTLSQADERIFVGVSSTKGATPTLALLELKNGSTVMLNLMPAPLSRNPDRNPEWLKTLWSLLDKSRPEPNR